MHIPGVFPERLFHSGAHGTGEFHIFRLWRLRPSGPTVPVVGLHTHELLVRVPCATRTEGRVRSLTGGSAKRVGTERISRHHPQRRPGEHLWAGYEKPSARNERGTRKQARGQGPFLRAPMATTDTCSVVIRLASDESDRAAVFVIRGAVFVAEQSVPIAEEWDPRDIDADHLIALHDGVPVGTVRMVVEQEGTGLLGRLAVLPDARGTGIGVALVRAVEEHARERGLSAVELHAQTHALGFYERLGYTAHGEEFLDAGIPHRHMVRELT